MTSLMALCALAVSLQGAGALGDITPQLEQIVQTLAFRYNTSISVAIKLDSGEEFIAANGPGVKPITTNSRIPVGSATKPITALSLMRLSEEGELNLDTPVADILDPWLAKQSPPVRPLHELFADQNITAVSTRHLLSMQSGLLDYNDSASFQWLLDHPGEDYLPMDYINDVAKKPFAFTPGSGVQYSSDGYVLAGLVLAAVQKKNTWEDLDQLASLGPIDGQPLQHTTFMKKGPCSKYPEVTHQYGLRTYRGFPGLRDAPTPDIDIFRADHGSGASCSAESSQMKNIVFEGVGTNSFVASSFEDCCEKASKEDNVYSFSFERNNCSTLEMPRKAKLKLGATSGFAVKFFNQSDVVDLYPYSCLNGWTMGNVAYAPIDAVRIWQALFVNKSVVKPQTLQTMMNFKEATGKFKVVYGYGLMKQQMMVKVKGRCSPPVCVCTLGLSCSLNATTIGHQGADWASGALVNGWMPHLNASLTVALTSLFSGMNQTITEHQNSNLGRELQCSLIKLIYEQQFPGYPELDCSLPKELEEQSLFVV